MYRGDEYDDFTFESGLAFWPEGENCGQIAGAMVSD